MPSPYELEAAAAKIRALVTSDEIQQLHGANEATTRLLLIDEVLSLLGWEKHEYYPEKPTPTQGYTDYQLSIDGTTRLIVEAKRIGRIEPLPINIQLPVYSNKYLHNNCGTEMRMLLRQCLHYCAECGTNYALATTGEIWIIFNPYKTGVAWDESKSLVFHSFDDLVNRFSEFYGLVSREAVKNNSLEEKFGSMVHVRPRVAIRPRDHIDEPLDVEPIGERRLIDEYFEQFMGEIAAPGQEDLLDHCYVDTRELTEFSHDLQRLLEFDSALDEQKDKDFIEPTDEQRLQKEVEDQFDSSKPRTILLVGNVGAGKTTFVHRFIRNRKRPERSVCIVVDLIDEAAVKVEQDRTEDQHLSEVILEKLAAEFQDKLDPYAPDVLRGCFEDDLQRYTRQMRSLVEQDPQLYQRQEAEYLWKQTEDRYKHLKGYLKYARKRRHKAWIVFDNVDQGSDSYQAYVYGFAHRLAKEARCVTLITLRADTYLEAERAGFLDVRGSDIVFKITAPEFKQVISRRRKYVNWIIQNDRIPRVFRSNGKLLCLLNSHINRLIVSDNNTVRAVFVTFSSRNVRLGLKILREYYTSYHSTFQEFFEKHRDSSEIPQNFDLDYDQEYNRVIQSLMLGNRWSYREGKILNLFSVDPQEQSSPFLKLRILAYLSLDRNTSSSRVTVQYDQLSRDFVFLGYQRHHIDVALSKLMDGGLVVAPKLPVTTQANTTVELGKPFTSSTKLALTPKGYYYLNTLAAQPYYQTRVGEDMYWYDKDAALLYVKCLQESVKDQAAYEHVDALQITDARSIFINYLKKTLLEEIENSATRATSNELVAFITDKVERSIFGHTVSRSVVVTVGDRDDNLEQSASTQPAHVRLYMKKLKQQQSNQAQAEQMTLLENETHDIKVIKEAVSSLGTLPRELKYKKSTNVVRVLWALEVALRAGLSQLRASQIALLIREYGQEAIEATNVAKFLRNQRHGGEFVHLWKEEPDGLYAISSVGRELLASLMEPVT